MQNLLTPVMAVNTPDPQMRRRGQATIAVALVQLLSIVIALPVVLALPRPLAALIALATGLGVISGTILLARARQVAVAGWFLVLFSSVSVAVPYFIQGSVDTGIFFLVLPLIIAGMVLRPWQVWLAFGLVTVLPPLVFLRARALVPEDTLNTLALSLALMLFMTTLLVFLSARISWQALDESGAARATAEAAARELERLNATLEAQVAARTADLSRALASIEERAAAQERLLEELAQQHAVIREMSVPVLPISTKTLVMPLVGALDSGRLQLVQSQALEALERTRALRLVLDVTGVPIVDSQVAQGIVTVVQAARLLGTETVLVGIRPEVAQALVGLGVNLHDIGTASDLHSAIRQEVRGT